MDSIDSKEYVLPSTPQEAALPVDSVEVKLIDGAPAIVVRGINISEATARDFEIPLEESSKYKFDFVHFAPDEILASLNASPASVEEGSQNNMPGEAVDMLTGLLRLKSSRARPGISTQTLHLGWLMQELFKGDKGELLKDFKRDVRENSGKPFLYIYGHGEAKGIFKKKWVIGDEYGNEAAIVDKVLEHLNPDNYSAIAVHACNASKLKPTQANTTPIYYAEGLVGTTAKSTIKRI